MPIATTTKTTTVRRANAFTIASVRPRTACLRAAPRTSRRSPPSARRREPALPPKPSWFGASPNGAPPRRDHTGEQTEGVEEDFGPMGAVPHDVCEEYNSN